jgi:hypothetical protein
MANAFGIRAMRVILVLASFGLWNLAGQVWIPTYPPLGSSPAMAYDAGREEMVLFEGRSTWVWNGRTWTQKSSRFTPTERISRFLIPTRPVMAYDNGHNEIVLFGGNAGNETWTWNGNEWVQQFPVVSPTPAYASAMAYDATHQQIVLLDVGTPCSQCVAQTWTWDGNTWTRQNSNIVVHTSELESPPAAAMTFDAKRGQVVLFFPHDNTTWIWNGAHWIQKFPVTSPAVFNECPGNFCLDVNRDGLSLAYDAARGVVVLWGGLKDYYRFESDYFWHFYHDTWVWDGNNWAQEFPAHSPPGRFSAAMAYDVARSQMILFGGRGPVLNGEGTWLGDGSDWIQIRPVAPPARNSAGMAYDAARGETVLFGGNGSRGPLNDTWVWDGKSWNEQFPLLSPPARKDFAMSYDAARGQVVLFGGTGADKVQLNDTWVWNGSSWIEKQSSVSPPARSGYAMVYDAARDEVVLFGGRTSESLNDTWVWNGVSWTEKLSALSPPARYGHIMAYDADQRRVILEGGTNLIRTPDENLGVTGTVYTDTWSWDGFAWRSESTSTGEGVWRHAAAYDALSHKIVLFGGYHLFESSIYGSELEAQPETTLWDGHSWVSDTNFGFYTSGLNVEGPFERGNHAMAYDAQHGQVVLFGGDTGVTNPNPDVYVYPDPASVGTGLLNETWLWTAGPAPLPSSDFLVTTNGFVYSRVSETYVGNVSVKNVGASTIEGPLEVLFTDLPDGISLTNPFGLYLEAPYSIVPGVTSLAPQESTSFAVQFSAPMGRTISFTPRLVSGRIP